MKFISKLKEKVKNTKDTQSPFNESLSVEELEAAETLWLREVQNPIVSGDKFEQQKLFLELFTDDKRVSNCTAEEE